MFRYIFVIVFSVFLAGIFPASAEEQGLEFYISDNTPASFFSSGIPTYFFEEGRVGIFKYSNDTFYFGSEDSSKISSLHDVEAIVADHSKGELLLIPDGSAKFLRSVVDDYACPWDTLQNCLYSDVQITAIDVKNLMGKIDMSAIDNELELKNKTIKFPIGAKVYGFKTVSPLYDFEDFTDFSGLICSKNEDDMCRRVVFEGSVDMVALFELIHGNGDLNTVTYTHIGKGDLAYVYDIENMTVTPYSSSCLEQTLDIKAMSACSKESELGKGTITEHRHKKTGIIYWLVDYKNQNIDNVIFWLNSHGEPFKVYTNPHIIKHFNMYNKTAAESIFSLM